MRYHIFRANALRLSLVCLAACVLFGVLTATGRFSALGREVFSSSPQETDEASLCLDFLRSFGWETAGDPDVKPITIPLVFDEVYTRYNEEIQLPGGYDLRRYAGRQVTLYAFAVVNYPTEDKVTANVLVCDGAVIGGDLCSARLDGFMHGFTMPDGIALPTLTQLED